MKKDMTVGSPWRLLLTFAVPLILGNLLQQTYNVMDAALVGRFLGEKELAAVGATTSVQFFTLGFCNGTCAGFSIPVAQWFGAGDHQKMKNRIFHALILGGLMALLLTVFFTVFCHPIMHFMSTPEDIYSNAYSYLFIIFCGIPFQILYNLLAGILRAVGDSRTPFLFLAGSTVLNILLDCFCIIVLHWGCAGAAIATVTSQAVSGFSCLAFTLKKYDLLQFAPEERIMSKTAFTELITMGIPMGLQFSITAIGSMVMQSANNSLGSVYTSGFTAGTRIKQFALCPFEAFGIAISVYCGQNLGARKYARIKKGVMTGILISAAYGLGVGLIMVFFGRSLSGIFLKASAVEELNISARYTFFLGSFFWLLGPLNVLRNAIQGMGYSGRTVFSGGCEMIARTTVSFCLLSVLGYNAICMADPTAWIAAVAYLTPTYLLTYRQAVHGTQKIGGDPAEQKSL